jgi:hypothetical protein
MPEGREPWVDAGDEATGAVTGHRSSLRTDGHTDSSVPVDGQTIPSQKGVVRLGPAAVLEPNRW